MKCRQIETSKNQNFSVTYNIMCENLEYKKHFYQY